MKKSVRSSNARNAEALADLGEFYFSRRPAVVGGGTDKAEGVAAQLDKIDPVRAHDVAGPYRRKNARTTAAAERELQAGRLRSRRIRLLQWMTLASFYRHRERWTEMESALRTGAKAADRGNRAGVAVYNGGSLLIKTNRDPARAAKMLEQYLAGSAKTEEAPAFVAHTMLARLKEQLGDAAAASREKAAALALAQEYKPAQNLKY